MSLSFFILRIYIIWYKALLFRGDLSLRGGCGLRGGGRWGSGGWRTMKNWWAEPPNMVKHGDLAIKDRDLSIDNNDHDDKTMVV